MHENSYQENSRKWTSAKTLRYGTASLIFLHKRSLFSRISRYFYSARLHASAMTENYAKFSLVRCLRLQKIQRLSEIDSKPSLATRTYATIMHISLDLLISRVYMSAMNVNQTSPVCKELEQRATGLIKTDMQSGAQCYSSKDNQ